MVSLDKNYFVNVGVQTEELLNQSTSSKVAATGQSQQTHHQAYLRTTAQSASPPGEHTSIGPAVNVVSPPEAPVDISSSPLALRNLPSDVLSEIFCHLSCEETLLGAVAKVNREFRRIALEPHTRECVQDNFVQEHKKECTACNDVPKKGSDAFDRFRYSIRTGLFCCVRCMSVTTKGKLTFQATDTGETVLHLAAMYGHVDIIRYLIEERGAPDLIHKINNNGSTILHFAAEYGHIDVIRYFIEERGATDLINLANNDEYTVLHDATLYGHIDIVRYLIEERGATDLVNKVNNKGCSVLHYAAENGHVNIVRYLIEERGATDLINLANNDGETVLHHAAENGHVNIIRYLIEERGATDLMFSRNNDGETALALANLFNESEVALYLESKM